MRSKPRTVLIFTMLILSHDVRAQTLDSNVLGSQSEKRPKWEAGVAGVTLKVANYPAADEYQTLALPAPYFVYRGRTLQSDDDGSRIRQVLTPNAELSVSGGGALSSNSSGSDARDGMPDLGYLLEAGPNLRLTYDGFAPKAKILVDIPVRGVVSLDHRDLHWRGAVFAPELAYQSQSFLHGKLTLRPSIGVEIASTALQRYYYEVQPRYATVGRAAYSASAGYLGASIGALATYELSRRVRVFAAMGYNNHAGAANRDSPLFRSVDDYSAVTGFSWSFFQSRQRAEE